MPKENLQKNSAKVLNYELCVSIIKDFQETHPKVKYKSDFEVFIRESKMEDFTFGNAETINVSTIHKAKGKEFDNVYLLLDNFDANSDDKKRELYVAMTRAKQNLILHTNNNYFRNIDVEDLEYLNDANIYSSPEKLTIHLTHQDVYLGYFKFVQRRLNLVISGQKLLISDEGLLNLRNELIIKFSKQFAGKKEGLEKDGFTLTKAKVNFILYWKTEEEEEPEIRIVLPELLFEKQHSYLRGSNVKPQICIAQNLTAVSRYLPKVVILNDDFTKTMEYASKDSVFYFDPPYKPISVTFSFNSYSDTDFNDAEQIRLKKFCDKLDKKGIKWILSNSDVQSVNPENNFFDDLVESYNIKRVLAKRSINSNPEKRGKLTELLIKN